MKEGLAGISCTVRTRRLLTIFESECVSVSVCVCV